MDVEVHAYGAVETSSDIWIATPVLVLVYAPTMLSIPGNFKPLLFLTEVLLGWGMLGTMGLRSGGLWYA